MKDDLEFLRAHIPDYREYGEESARHDTDMRIRAFVGERLSEAQARFGVDLAGATKDMLEAVLFRCMFADQALIHKFEHATLAPAALAALVGTDRALVASAERLSTVTIADLPALLGELDAEFNRRGEPSAVST